MEDHQKSREHQANERTFLAWIRTSLALMAFGFVVVKFSLFLKQLAFILQKEVTVTSKGYSGILGTLLVIFGLVVALFAYIRYRKMKKQISNNSFAASGLLPEVLIGIFLVIGVLLVVYLLSSI